MKKNSFILKTFILLLSISLGFLVACSGPEDQLADKMEDLTSILEDNMDSPDEGVKDVRKFLINETPEIMRLIGEIAVELDKIEDADERAERLEEIIKTLEEPGKKLAEIGEKFGDKAKDNKDAQKEMQELMSSIPMAEGYSEILKF